MKEEKTTSQHFPSIESRESLNTLSKSFTPTDVKFLLALNTNFSLEECIDNANGMVKRLQKFVDNGNSDEGLDFKYSKITVF